MARLPDPTGYHIFNLARRIVESIDTTTAVEFRLLTQWGETAETLTELEELQNIKDSDLNILDSIPNQHFKNQFSIDMAQ